MCAGYQAATDEATLSKKPRAGASATNACASATGACTFSASKCWSALAACTWVSRAGAAAACDAKRPRAPGGGTPKCVNAPTPALFTNTVIGPTARAARHTRIGPSGDVRSSTTVCTGTLARNGAATASRRTASRPCSTRPTPSRARRWAIAAPMPLEAPVTSAAPSLRATMPLRVACCDRVTPSRNHENASNATQRAHRTSIRLGDEFIPPPHARVLPRGTLFV